jgi:hypothetical protein
MEKTFEPFPKGVTIGEMYGPAMKITDQANADEYFERCVEYGMRVGGQTRAQAESIQRQNLGYFAGYYDSETMERVNRLFRTVHPIFGATVPTAQEALEAGKRLATE